MHNIILFIRRFWTTIAFFILQIVSLYLLFTYNRVHKAKGLGVAGEVTGYFNTKYNSFEDFFRMKEENRRVHALNDSLMNLLRGNFTKADSGYVNVDSALASTVDTLNRDTSNMKRQYRWMTAEVVYATVASEKNYIQINKGSKQGIKDDMGVFSSNGGFVGRIINTGANFSEVMPLVHVMNKLSVQLKRTGSGGVLSWDGKSPIALTLTGINRSDSVRAGDTVLTGKYSISYPPGKMVGTVSNVRKEQATNFLVLEVKPTANFGNLQQVFIAENMNAEEQRQLHNETVKKVEAVQTGNK